MVQDHDRQVAPRNVVQRALQGVSAALSGSRWQGAGVIALAVLLLALGVLGAQWALGDGLSVSASLASAVPGLFPSPTPTATSTPTVDEQIATLLAEADQAWLALNAQEAIQELEKAQALKPEHEQIRHRLFVAHSTLGLKLAEEALWPCPL